MFNFVQRVLVGKASGAVSTTQTVGSPLNLATVQVGDLYLLDENGLVLDAAAAATALRVRVARGTGNAKVTLSSLIVKPSASTRYTFEAYSAPVAQVSQYTGLATTLTANTQYQLQVIIPQDLPIIANRQDRITVSLFTGPTITDGTAELDRLVANFNKQRAGLQGIIVASRSGSNLILTGQSIPTQGIADYEFVRFDSNFLQITNSTTGATLNPFIATQPTSTTAAAGGKGVAVQVRQLERIALGNSGFTYARDQWYRGAFPYGAVDGIGYDIYNVQQHVPGEGMLQDTKTYPISTLIAINTSVSGTSQRVTFGAILDAFMASTATTPPTGE